MRQFLCAAALISAACTSSIQFVDHATLRRPTSAEYPNAPAVVLLRDHRFLVIAPLRLAATYVELRHDVIAILGEAGFPYATLRIPLPEHSQLLELRARTISPTGEVREVRPEEVFEAHGRGSAARGRHQYGERVMRLPGVAVGTILEYGYRVEHQEILWWTTDKVSDKIPVRRYHGEVSTSSNIEGDLKIYNAAERFKLSHPFEETRATLDMENIAAERDELLDPPWELAEPWWAYRSTSVSYGDVPHPLYGSWADVTQYVSKKLYGERTKQYQGAELTLPDRARCKEDRRCVLELALTFLRERTPLSGFEKNLDELRPMKEVLASGRANNFEKAILLHGILAQAGVASHYALVARRAGLVPDPRFPLPGRFDHLVLEIPDQPGLSQAVVDPSCEACALGQLPTWIEARPITALFESGKPGAGQALIDLTKLPRIAWTQPSTLRETIDARLDGNGALTGTILVEELGTRAVDGQINRRDWLPARWTQALEQALHARDKTATLGEHAPQVCDRKTSQCQHRYAYSTPGYATVDRGELVVPLSFLPFNAGHDKNEGPRTRDVFVPRDDRQIETITFRLPAGYVVGELPTSAAWHSEPLDATLEISHTATEIVVRRSLTFHRGRWDKSHFAALDAALGAFRGVGQRSLTLRRAPAP